MAVVADELDQHGVGTRGEVGAHAGAGFGPDAVGVILDQDLDATPVQARDRLAADFAKEKDLPVALELNLTPGTVVHGAPRLGLYVLPDNQDAGTLENLIPECADRSYPALKIQAKGYRGEALSNAELNTADREVYGLSGSKKEGSMLKPDRFSWIGRACSICFAITSLPTESVRPRR